MRWPPKPRQPAVIVTRSPLGGVILKMPRREVDVLDAIDLERAIRDVRLGKAWRREVAQ